MVEIARRTFPDVYTVELRIPDLVQASGWSFNPAQSNNLVAIDQGGTLTATISCRNDGNADGQAAILTVIGSQVTDRTPLTTFSPGQTRSLNNATLINLSPGDYSAASILEDWSFGSPEVIVQDLFTLRVRSTEPILVADSSFSFSPSQVNNIVTIQQGQTLTISIFCRNDGGSDGLAVVATSISGLSIDRGFGVTIRPGTRSAVSNATLINLSPGDYSSFVLLEDHSSGIIDSLAQDLFTLRVTAPPGPASPAGAVNFVAADRSTATPSTLVNFSYNLSFGTDDSNGNPITWPYQWRIRELINGVQVGNDFVFQESQPNTTFTRTIPLSAGSTAQPGDQYRVVVSLRAAASDSQGNPLPGYDVFLDSEPSSIITIV